MLAGLGFAICRAAEKSLAVTARPADRMLFMALHLAPQRSLYHIPADHRK